MYTQHTEQIYDNQATAPYDPKAAACLGCRIRRRKCDRKKPVCTGCLDLNVPPNLCVYRSVGIMSKDSKNTLSIIKSQNKDLKDQLVALRDFLRKQQSSQTANIPVVDNSVAQRHRPPHGQNDEFIQAHKLQKQVVDNTTYKHFQLNPARNPLLCTVKETNLSLTHYGSLSSEAFCASEPSLKLLTTQINTVIRRERLKYDSKRKRFGTVVEKDEKLNNIKLKFLDRLIGLSNENDYEILDLLIKEVEANLPDSAVLNLLIKGYFIHNVDRFVVFVYVDEESTRRSFDRFLDLSKERPKININLPEEVDKVPGLLLLLGAVVYSTFLHSVTIGSKHSNFNYLLYLEYAEAILATKPFCSPKLLLNLESLVALTHIIGFERYTPHGRVMDHTADGAENVIIAKKLLLFARGLLLHKDIDFHYADQTSSVRKSIKNLWFFFIHLESLETFESGIPSRIPPDTLKLYPDYSNSITRMTVVINELLDTYMKIESLADTYKLVDKVENQCIKPLKAAIHKEFGSLQAEIDLLQNFNFDDLSLIPKFRYMVQQMVIRLLASSILQAFHQVCFKRLEQIGDRSPKYERFKILTWKYSMLVPHIVAEVLCGFQRLSYHSNHLQFHVIASLLQLYPVIRLAEKRMGIYASARILEILKIENSTLIKKLLKGKNNRDREIHEILKNKGQYQHCYASSDFDDFEIDDNFEALIERFARFQDVKYIVVIFSKKMLEILDLLVNGNYNFNYMKLNYGFFLILKMSSLFLNIIFPYEQLTNTKKSKEEQSTSEEDFDFNELFKTAIDTSSNKFDFESFFTGFGNIYQANEINDFFAANASH